MFLSRESRWPVVIVLILWFGAHWTLLQSVAWVGMFAHFSKDAPFTEALSMVFDGKHPCRLCKAIQQGRAGEKEKDQQGLRPISKLDLGIVWQTTEFDFTCDRERIPVPDTHAPSHRDAPPKPRPRFSSPGFVV